MTNRSKLGSTMAGEMADQEAVLRNLVERRESSVKDARELAGLGWQGVSLVARGSSDNAALLGRYAIELATGRPVALGALSMYNRYGARSKLKGWLVVGISQSGETPEVVEYLTMARASGASTIGITNGSDSALAGAVDLPILLDAGPELAVPATKTFTATVAALLFVAESLGNVPWVDQWTRLPDAVAECLDDPTDEAVIEGLAESQRSIVVARGFLTAAAAETALKLQETTGRMVAAYSSADLYHGPIVSFGEETSAIVIGADGPTRRDAIEVADALRKRRVGVVTVGSAHRNADLATPTLHDALSVITTSARGQQLALALARRLDRDPDHPDGLRKVTPTR